MFGDFKCRLILWKMLCSQYLWWATFLLAGVSLKTVCLSPSVLSCFWGCEISALQRGLQAHQSKSRLTTCHQFQEVLHSGSLHYQEFQYPFGIRPCGREPQWWGWDELMSVAGTPPSHTFFHGSYESTCLLLPGQMVTFCDSCESPSSSDLTRQELSSSPNSLCRMSYVFIVFWVCLQLIPF